jgi:hypothetical protein
MKDKDIFDDEFMDGELSINEIVQLINDPKFTGKHSDMFSVNLTISELRDLIDHYVAMDTKRRH